MIHEVDTRSEKYNDNPFGKSKLGNMTLFPYDENELHQMESYFLDGNLEELQH